MIHTPRVEAEGQGAWIKPIPVELATAFWLYKAIKGNEKAQLLAQSYMDESIERRADQAFEFRCTEEEYNQKFGERLVNALAYNRNQLKTRRLPSDKLYLQLGIPN